jgi:chemotaxis protein methyltransferase CheR
MAGFMNDISHHRFDGPREYPYTPDDFAAIAAMVHAHSGICLPPTKTMLVYSRLAKLVRESGLANFADYVALIRRDAEARGRAIEAMTTNHTKFFREIHHFDHFRQDVRGPLLDRIAGGGRVRLWSAAASSGEEPYSLAMTLLGPDVARGRVIAGGDVAILATDLSGAILDTARAGRYAAIVAGDMPTSLSDAWTEIRGRDLSIASTVRDIVRFRRLNLLNAWPMRGKFDAIFCRNVMIYFDEPTRELLIRRLCDQLATGGYLYIGHSERILGSASDRLRPIGQTVYRKDRA